MSKTVLKIAACGAVALMVACSGSGASQTSTVTPATIVSATTAEPTEPTSTEPAETTSTVGSTTGVSTSVLLGPDAEGIHKISHVVVIMQENRSFDTYFGTYPGADGIPTAYGQPTVCVPDPAANTCVSQPLPRPGPGAP